MMKYKKQESGIVLVMTLWVIVILSTISLAYVKQVDMEIKMVGFQRDISVVEETAKAGIRQAMILLREDRIKDSGEEVQSTIVNFTDDDTFAYDGGNEPWAEGIVSNEDLYYDIPFFENGDKVGYYYVAVEDESSKFPINNMQTSREMIQHLLELTGVEEDHAQFLSAAIIDWRDPDNTITDTGKSRFGSDGDSETSYYNSMVNTGRRGRRRGNFEIPAVIIKNERFSTIDELLLIPGMTPEIVFGTVDPDDNPQRGRFGRRRLRKGEYLGLKNFVTVYSNKFNLNSVKSEVLESVLFPIVGEDKAEKMALEWTDYRDGRDRIPLTEDDQVIKTFGNEDMDNVHYTEVDGFTPELVEGQLKNFVSIGSQVFVITSVAEYQGIEKGFRAVVSRQYIPWDQLPVFGIDTNDLRELQQARIHVRVFEPLFDARSQIAKMS